MAHTGAGAPRKPTKLKALHATLHPERVNQREPMPRDRVPEAPADMGAEARVLWDRIVLDYGHTGILTGIDAETFRAYCDVCVTYAATAVQLDHSTILVIDKYGRTVPNPLLKAARDSAYAMLRLARELGFTPSARASLSTPVDSGDELDAWNRTG